MPMEIDSCSGFPWTKDLMDFSPLVVLHRMAGKETEADMIQYLINRCARAEANAIIDGRDI
jgi:hypothetical protein